MSKNEIVDVQSVHQMYGCTPPGRAAIQDSLKISVVKVKLLILLDFLFWALAGSSSETYAGGVYTS